VGGQALLRLQHDQRQALLFAQRQGRGQPHDAATHYRTVEIHEQGLDFPSAAPCSLQAEIAKRQTSSAFALSKASMKLFRRLSTVYRRCAIASSSLPADGKLLVKVCLSRSMARLKLSSWRIRPKRYYVAASWRPARSFCIVVRSMAAVMANALADHATGR
jgi:hypothetical protein